MFTGIIEHIADITGHTLNKDILTLQVARPADWELQIGQSIAVNGVCLTVTKYDQESFSVEIMPETTKRTGFGPKTPGKVNLERAMSPNSLFEGHIVQGHVDGISVIKNIDQSPQWRTLQISYPSEKAGLLVEKGSIAIDGISLTIVDVADDWFSVSLIPHTIAHTTLGSKKVGDSMNIEFDVFGKFVERQLSLRK